MHRIIEQHAATRGAAPAIVDGSRCLTYRELNYAANALARRLMAHGFRRGSRAIVRLPRSAELAVALLATLKAGGSYTWQDPARESCFPDGISFSINTGGREEKYFHLCAGTVLGEQIPCSPNLPIVTRATDVACVLEDGDGSPGVLVPHATIAAFSTGPSSPVIPWGDDAAALDLWTPLMSGAAAVVDGATASIWQPPAPLATASHEAAAAAA